ncbi:hypothetical protein AKJ09_01674 [Labilithrix luteola]|uniref:Uncharacterized protein n=1 Tax=Labilithrix luteola TaxID=1391654 RepID=A0A0K1PN94_9BACT|nr:hypothetical protein [Labilithrix luteola]AKU95010.1 hypothetical protein AKJ09_01674 [Labilithrix luteola]
MFKRTLGLAALSVMAAACTAAGDDAMTSEDQGGALVITPTGTDARGALLVQAPPGATAVGEVALSNEINGVQQNVTVLGSIGQTITGLAPGSRRFFIRTVLDHENLIEESFDTDIAAGKTTTLMSAQAVIDATGPRTVGLRGTFDVRNPRNLRILPSLSTPYNTAENPAYGSSKRSTALGTVTGDNVTFGLWGTTYRVAFGILDGAEFKINAGTTGHAKLTEPAGRRRARIVAPDSRTLPIASCNGQNSDAYVLSTNDYGSPSYASGRLGDGESVEVGIASWIDSSKHYLLQNAVWGSPIDLPTGAPGDAPADLVLEHLDIEDVVIDGANKVRGTYEVRRADSQSNFLRCKLPTNTGVDIPPAHGGSRSTTTFRRDRKRTFTSSPCLDAEKLSRRSEPCRGRICSPPRTRKGEDLPAARWLVAPRDTPGLWLDSRAGRPHVPSGQHIHS